MRICTISSGTCEGPMWCTHCPPPTGGVDTRSPDLVALTAPSHWRTRPADAHGRVFKGANAQAVSSGVRNGPRRAEPHRLQRQRLSSTGPDPQRVDGSLQHGAGMGGWRTGRHGERDDGQQPERKRRHEPGGRCLRRILSIARAPAPVQALSKARQGNRTGLPRAFGRLGRSRSSGSARR